MKNGTRRHGGGGFLPLLTKEEKDRLTRKNLKVPEKNTNTAGRKVTLTYQPGLKVKAGGKEKAPSGLCKAVYVRQRMGQGGERGREQCVLNLRHPKKKMKKIGKIRTERPQKKTYKSNDRAHRGGKAIMEWGHAAFEFS